MTKTASAPPRVGLFVTCLVDLSRPSVGFAAVKLMEDHLHNVERNLQLDPRVPDLRQVLRPVN